MAKAVLHLVLVASAVYGCLLLLLFFSQRRLVYYPSRTVESAAREQAERGGWERWTDAEGRFHGWREGRAAAGSGGGAARNRLLVFHGNAGHALHRGYFRDGFGALERGALWEVLVFEYPGYGPRGGSPSEVPIVEAAKAALASLLAEDSRPLFLLGESLGSGAAAALAEASPGKVAGIFLVTPFTSLPDAAAHHYRFVPVRLLLRDRFEVLAILAAYPGPLAVRVAGRDEILPPEMGRRLVEAHPGPARLWVEERARHNTLDYAPGHPFWGEVSSFLLEHSASPGEGGGGAEGRVP